MCADRTAEKRRLRRAMSARRRALPPDRAAAAAAAVTERLLAMPAILEAERVALYAALPDELPTRCIFDALGRRGTIRLFPRIGGPRDLEFAAVERWDELRAAQFGVPAPAPELPALRLGRGDRVLVPGLAFDRSGNRLGRGHGYYDRTFPPAMDDAPMLLGLAYEFQVVATLPHDARDRRMDAVVSERALHGPWSSGRVQ